MQKKSHYISKLFNFGYNLGSKWIVKIWVKNDILFSGSIPDQLKYFSDLHIFYSNFCTISTWSTICVRCKKKRFFSVNFLRDFFPQRKKVVEKKQILFLATLCVLIFPAVGPYSIFQFYLA